MRVTFSSVECFPCSVWGCQGRGSSLYTANCGIKASRCSKHGGSQQARYSAMIHETRCGSVHWGITDLRWGAPGFSYGGIQPVMDRWSIASVHTADLEADLYLDEGETEWGPRWLPHLFHVLSPGVRIEDPRCIPQIVGSACLDAWSMAVLNRLDTQQWYTRLGALGFIGGIVANDE